MSEEEKSPLHMLVCQDHPAQLPALQSSTVVGPAHRQECVPRYFREGRASRVAAAHPQRCGGWASLDLVRNQPI